MQGMRVAALVLWEQALDAFPQKWVVANPQVMCGGIFTTPQKQ